MTAVVAFAIAFSGALTLQDAGAQRQEEAQSCALTTPELEKALDAVHAARDGNVAQSERVVKKWLPRATQALGSDRKPPTDWLHLAVDLGRELTRAGRADEARKLFSRVAELDPEGDWGHKAAARIKEIDDHK